MRPRLVAGTLLVSMALSVPAFGQVLDPLVPAIDANPIENDNIVGILDAVLLEITEGAAPEIWDTGMLMWRALAAILVVWTGLRIAFTGDIQPWELVRLLFALWIPWVMLTFYADPIPGTTTSFPDAIVSGGAWLNEVIIGEVEQDWMEEYYNLMNGLYLAGVGVEGEGAQDARGLLGQLWDAANNLTFVVIGAINTAIFEVFLVLTALIILLVYCVTMMQVAFAHVALGILLMLGPMLIPFLLLEPLSFLFWGWFKGLWLYSLYGVIAAAIMRVFLAISQGFIQAIMQATASGGVWSLWEVTQWLVVLLPLLAAASMAAFSVGTIANQIISGGGGGGGGLAAAGGAVAGKVARGARTAVTKGIVS